MPEKPESKVQRKISELLKKNGIYVWKTHGGVYNKRGVADLLGVLPGGRFLAIEVKVNEKSKISALQEKFLEKINQAGGLGFVAWNNQMVIDKLASEGYKIG